MRTLLIAQVLITICGAAIFELVSGRTAALLFSAGGLVMFANLAVHVLVWPRILVKKQVAMSIGVIVIKFLILGWIIYEVATKICADDSLKLAWFGAGLATVVVSTFAAGVAVVLTSSRRSQLSVQQPPQ